MKLTLEASGEAGKAETFSRNVSPLNKLQEFGRKGEMPGLSTPTKASSFLLLHRPLPHGTGTPLTHLTTQ